MMCAHPLRIRSPRSHRTPTPRASARPETPGPVQAFMMAAIASPSVGAFTDHGDIPGALGAAPAGPAARVLHHRPAGCGSTISRPPARRATRHPAAGSPCVPNCSGISMSTATPLVAAAADREAGLMTVELVETRGGIGRVRAPRMRRWLRRNPRPSSSTRSRSSHPPVRQLLIQDRVAIGHAPGCRDAPHSRPAAAAAAWAPGHR